MICGRWLKTYSFKDNDEDEYFYRGHWGVMPDGLFCL